MRFFLALWPGDRVRESLASVSSVLAGLAQGRPVPEEKIHLTLAFLGEVAADRLDAVREAAHAAPGPRFEIILDEVGSFRDARVAWAGSSRVSPALLQWQARLDRALRDRGFVLEDRPFAAHVTLARRITTPVKRAPMPAIRWRPRALTLVQSMPGTGRYEVRESWDLAGG